MVFEILLVLVTWGTMIGFWFWGRAWGVKEERAKWVGMERAVTWPKEWDE